MSCSLILCSAVVNSGSTSLSSDDAPDGQPSAGLFMLECLPLVTETAKETLPLKLRNQIYVQEGEKTKLDKQLH